MIFSVLLVEYGLLHFYSGAAAAQKDTLMDEPRGSVGESYGSGACSFTGSDIRSFAAAEPLPAAELQLSATGLQLSATGLHLPAADLVPEEALPFQTVSGPWGKPRFLSGARTAPDALMQTEGETENTGRTHPDPLRLHFNLSHSGRFAVCAFCDEGEIGIDLQKGGLGAQRALKLSRRFFSQEDDRLLRAAPEGEISEHFIRLWAIHESYCKLTGEGLSIVSDFSTLQKDSLQGGVILRAGKKAARYSALPAPPGYQMVICAL